MGKGFNETNQKYFRQFYLAFLSYEKSHTVCDESFPALPRELSWSHYRLLMRVENVNARDYYMQEAATCNWSVRQLQRNINGQMDMYIRLFEDRMRARDDNPTIGVILCTEKDETIVKYSMLDDSKQLFASKYRLVLPSEEELRAEIERERRLFWAKQQIPGETGG